MGFYGISFSFSLGGAGGGMGVLVSSLGIFFLLYGNVYNKIIKIRSTSCEVEDFVETHFCRKLCVILRPRDSPYYVCA